MADFSRLRATAMATNGSPLLLMPDKKDDPEKSRLRPLPHPAKHAPGFRFTHPKRRFES